MRMRLSDFTTLRLCDYAKQIGRKVAQSHSRIVFLSLLLLPVLSRAQEAPPADTLPPVKDTLTLSEKWPVPRKALLWSIAPGGGQIYNKRWWKLPLVYGAFAGIVYSIDYNQGRYRRLKTALALKLDGLDHEWTGTTLDNARTLRILRDKYDKNTQLSYVGIVLVYALQGIEAFTDAHLRNFDISDDLSMRIQPTPAIHQLSGAPLPGLSIRLQLNPHTPAYGK
ncbi:MAG: hypothetical protein JNK77_08055 [Saprospiraceae bacterium]|nr:hypothetical protein [Saprospiraceae bacterium]